MARIRKTTHKIWRAMPPRNTIPSNPLTKAPAPSGPVRTREMKEAVMVDKEAVAQSVTSVVTRHLGDIPMDRKFNDGDVARLMIPPSDHLFHYRSLLVRILKADVTTAASGCGVLSPISNWRYECQPVLDVEKREGLVRFSVREAKLETSKGQIGDEITIMFMNHHVNARVKSIKLVGNEFEHGVNVIDMIRKGSSKSRARRDEGLRQFFRQQMVQGCQLLDDGTGRWCRTKTKLI